MGVLDLSHDQVSAFLAVYHDWKPCIVCLCWIIVGVGLIYVYWLFFSRHMSSDRRKVAVALVDGVRFRGKRWVNIALKGVDVGHWKLTVFHKEIL